MAETDEVKVEWILRVFWLLARLVAPSLGPLLELISPGATARKSYRGSRVVLAGSRRVKTVARAATPAEVAAEPKVSSLMGALIMNHQRGRQGLREIGKVVIDAAVATRNGKLASNGE